jgi:tellurite resistance protein TerC
MITFSELIEGVPIILSLVVIEGLLSVDNALAIAAMASELPPKQQRMALRLGILGAYIFRALALFFAGWIIANTWVKILGAAYLLYLMCAHLTREERGKLKLQPHKNAGLWMTVFSIELMDLSLSVDNVVAAVALSPKLWLVCTGVFIGILALRFLAGICIGLLERHPILSSTAFLLVGYVGALLLFEMASGRDIGSLGKFAGIAAIVFTTMLYGRSPRLQGLLAPMIRAVRIPMCWFSRIVEAVFWPLRALFLLVRGSLPVSR